MCILFMYNGSKEEESEYLLILASNRDEYYNRASQDMALWSDDPLVVAGRDLDGDSADSTWLALSPMRKKIGVLLNLPGTPKENAKSRGKLAASFAKTDKCTMEYVDHIKSYADNCNGFIFVSVELRNGNTSVSTYNNVTHESCKHTDTVVGFGNSLPESPLNKVEAGKSKLADICRRFNKINMEKELVQELIQLLKSTERHLPDHQLENRQPASYKALSSIFVSIPEIRYGTRTHTIILVTKKGHLTAIEITMQSPIDVVNPQWNKAEFQYNIDMDAI